MANNSLTQFKGDNSFGIASIKEQIELGIKFFLDWSFLSASAFVNVHKDDTSYLGGDASRLYPIDGGAVWQTSRFNWVWESGIENSTQPIDISGVWVSGEFKLQNDTSGYAHTVDYDNGAIVFTTPISPSSVVEAEYSYRYVYVAPVDKSPFLQELQFDSLNYTKGVGNLVPDQSVQLPAVGIKVVSSKFSPYQIGGGQWNHVKVEFTVVAENSHDRDVICDILGDQSDRSIYLIDINSGFVPHQDNPVMYPDIVLDEDYRFHKCFWGKTEKSDYLRLNQNLFLGRVTTILDIARIGI